MTRSGLGLIVIAVAVAAGCVRLGVWQLERRAERRALNATIAARRAAPPLALPGAPWNADSVWQRRVEARGVFDYARERVWMGRSFDGVPGVAILTPLRLADGSAVLVDRGWVPAADARSVDLGATREPDSALVAGLALRAPRGRGDADPAALGDSLPYALAPFVVQWLPGERSHAATPLPVRRWPAPRLDDGPHLSYAVQWFAFAAIAIGGAIALRRSGGRARPAAPPPPR